MDRDKTTRPVGCPQSAKDFPRGAQEKERVRAQTDSLTYDISSVQSGVSIKFKSKETGRRMTPSFSRPCLWWSNPNRQAKRPSFRDDRTPRSMFYLPMLNPLSPSFPHKLRWRSSYSHPYSSIQFSLRLAIRINNRMGMGVGTTGCAPVSLASTSTGESSRDEESEKASLLPTKDRGSGAVWSPLLYLFFFLLLVGKSS